MEEGRGGRESISAASQVSGPTGTGKNPGSQRKLSGSDTKGSATCNSSNYGRRGFEEHWSGGILCC